MTETLESLLNMLCKTVARSQQNAQQTVYTLTDGKDAKLAYDLLVACNADVKYFADANAGNKLYVQNASLAACADKIAAILGSATLFKQIKNLLDSTENAGNYSLSFINTAHGRQLTLLLPPEKSTASNAPAAKSAAPEATQSPVMTSPRPKTPVLPKDEDALLAGPTVARKAIPKSFKASATEEDPLRTRIMLYLSSRVFTSTAWTMFALLILAVIFSIIITIRGFLCPDIAGVQNVPAYCPRKIAPQQQE
ncbi:MAG: hypothetical protein SFX19_03995 [Alphaproteobacteria bacterium]|nr:hypothetical protein [Alphaproteobacteria bacterium]